MIFEGTMKFHCYNFFYIDVQINSNAVKSTKENVKQHTGINHSRHLMLNNTKIFFLESVSFLCILIHSTHPCFLYNF